MGSSQAPYVLDHGNPYSVLHDAMQSVGSELRKVSELTLAANPSGDGSDPPDDPMEANMRQLARTASGRPLRAPSRSNSQKHLQACATRNTASVTHTVQLFAAPAPEPVIHIGPVSYSRQYFGEEREEVVEPNPGPNRNNPGLNAHLAHLGHLHATRIIAGYEEGDGSITLSPSSPHVMFDVPGGDLYSPRDDDNPPIADVDFRLAGSIAASYGSLPDGGGGGNNGTGAASGSFTRPGGLQIGQLANLMDMFAAETSPGPLIKPRQLNVHAEHGVARYASLSSMNNAYSPKHPSQPEPPQQQTYSARHSQPEPPQQQNQHKQRNQYQPAPPSGNQQGGPGVGAGARAPAGAAYQQQQQLQLPLQAAGVQAGPRPPAAARQGTERHPSPATAHAAAAADAPVAAAPAAAPPGQPRHPSPATVRAAAAIRQSQPAMPAAAAAAVQAGNSGSTDSPARLPPRPRTASNKPDTSSSSATSTSKPAETATETAASTSRQSGALLGSTLVSGAGKVPQLMQDLPLAPQPPPPRPPVSQLPAPSLSGIAAVLNMPVPTSAPAASALPPLQLRGREQFATVRASLGSLPPGSSTSGSASEPSFRAASPGEDSGQLQQQQRNRSPSPFRRETSLASSSQEGAPVAGGAGAAAGYGAGGASIAAYGAGPPYAAGAGHGVGGAGERDASPSTGSHTTVSLQRGSASGYSPQIDLPPAPTTGVRQSGSGISTARSQQAEACSGRGSEMGSQQQDGLAYITNMRKSGSYFALGQQAPDDSPPIHRQPSTQGSGGFMSLDGTGPSGQLPPRAMRPPMPRGVASSVDVAQLSSMGSMTSSSGAGGAGGGGGGAGSRYTSPMAPPRGAASSCLVRSRDASPATLRNPNGTMGGGGSAHPSRDTSPAARCGMTSLSGEPLPLPAAMMVVHAHDMSGAVVAAPGGALPGVTPFIPMEAMGKLRSSSSSWAPSGGTFLPALPASSRHTSRHNSRDASPLTTRVSMEAMNRATAAGALDAAAGAGGAGGKDIRASSNDPLHLVPTVPGVVLRRGLERELQQAANDIRMGPAWKPNGAPILADLSRHSGDGRLLRAQVLSNPTPMPGLTHSTVYIGRGHNFDLVARDD